MYSLSEYLFPISNVPSSTEIEGKYHFPLFQVNSDDNQKNCSVRITNNLRVPSAEAESALLVAC